jgi:hypothetical protein
MGLRKLGIAQNVLMTNKLPSKAGIEQTLSRTYSACTELAAEVGARSRIVTSMALWASEGLSYRDGRYR